MMSYLDKVFAPDLDDEVRWERIRIYRDFLLKDSDWRMVEDACWDKTLWAQYRQELRDLPQTQKDPSKIIFPSAPDA